MLNAPATTEIYTLSLHDALPISSLTPLIGERIARAFERAGVPEGLVRVIHGPGTGAAVVESGVAKVFFTGSVEAGRSVGEDRKSTRLNSSHTVISYAVFCLKKKR